MWPVLTYTLRLLALTVFMVVMTNFILLIGAGLFSKALYAFEEQHFNDMCVPVRFPSLLSSLIVVTLS